MSIFSDLLAKFKKKEPVAPLNLSLQDALHKLDEESKNIVSTWEAALEGIRADLPKISEDLEKNIEKLFDTQLLNKNIEVRHRQIMEGNRDAYARKVRAFKDYLLSRIEGTISESLIKDLHARQDELLRGTQKSYFVLQEFLANESRKIAGSLKAMDQLITRLDTALTAREDAINSVDTLKRRLSLLISRHKTNPEAVLKEAKNHLKMKEKELENFFKSKDYTVFTAHEKEIAKIDEELSAKVGELTRLLSALDRPLRKYTKVALDLKSVEKVVSSDAPEHLVDSQALLSVLPALKRSIESGGITLKDRQKERSLQAIEELGQRMSEMSLSYAELIEKSSSLSSLDAHAKTREREAAFKRSVDAAAQALTSAKNRDAQESPLIALPELEEKMGSILGVPVRFEPPKNL